MFGNQRGFTLMQVLTGAAMMAIVGLIISGVFQWLNNEFLSVSERLKAETMAARAETLLRQYFAQAVYIQNTGNPPGAANGPGMIRAEIPAGNPNQILYDQIADVPTWRTIAVFQREFSVGDAVVPAAWRADARRTAIFYRGPSATTSGVLFIDDGSADPMVPSYADIYIDRLTYLSITKNRHPTFDRVASLDIRMRFRYHLPGRTRNWCPQLDITNGVAGCTGVQNHREIEASFNILLRNNLLRAPGANMASTGSNAEERVLGNLYFFRPYLPVR